MSRAEETVWLEYERVVEPWIRRGNFHRAGGALDYVIEQYNQPHRVYHSVEHLADVLTALRRWRWRLSDVEYLMAFVALLLHDVEYHIPAKEQSNESLSKDWVEWFLAVVSLRIYVDRLTVEAAIKVTEGHQPTNLIELVVCWCDLAGFTKGTASVKAHSDKIRQEYLTAYTPEQYEAGRRAFLASYRNPFKTYPGASLSLRIRARWLNRKANRQLDRELAELNQGAES